MKWKFNIKQLIYFVILLLSGISQAQTGIVTGKIIDKASGETILGAIIEVKQNNQLITGAATDFNGEYRIELSPGLYEVSISYLSYATYKMADVPIAAKENYHLDVALESETVSLSEIVIKADAVRSSETALIALQRKASAIQDGISSQQISRTGSANAADAIRQLPAAVIQDGRYIVVRGLGDRYSLSQLNGITMPSTDPYRNSSSMDLIPGNIIENIISVKSFTPDLPGNFSGGLINIETQSIPDKFTLSIGASGGYNAQSTLIENFQRHEVRGKFDSFGFNDGSRDLPGYLNDENIRNQLSTSTYLSARQPGNEAVRNIFHQSAKSLSNSFIPQEARSPLNMGLSFSLGHRFDIFNKDFGFNLSLNYSSAFQHYDDGIIASYINTNTDFLFPYQKLQESKSVENPSLGGLFSTAFKISDNHILKGSLIFNNDAEIIARSQRGEYLGQVSNSLAEFNTRSLEYIQRQLANYQFGGKHVIPTFNNFQIEWSTSLTRSFQDEPDLRYFAYTRICEDPLSGAEGCEYYINNSEIAYPYHFFRRLNDIAYDGKLDITLPFGQNGVNALKVGGLFSFADRDFAENRYQLNNSGVHPSLNFSTFDGDLNGFLDLRNFGIIDTLYNADGTVQRYVTGYHYINQVNERNFYTGSSDLLAAYGMLTYQVTERIKTVTGLRVEQTNMEVTSADTSIARGIIDRIDYLPSVNVVYALTENSNLRIAASQTLARPNMRELAPFHQFDTKNGFFNVGNPALKRTLIRNYDLRFEHYPAYGELIAASVFYKQFNDPIIRAFNPKATIPELSFINVEKAIIAGVELEVRKNLSFIHPVLDHFHFNSNIAIIHSRYAIPEEEIINAKNIDPEYAETVRPFQGQAPFIVNAALAYLDPGSGFEASLAYNVSGRKLYNISLFATPDMYEEPLSMLDFKISKRLGLYQFSFTARNILDAGNKKTLTFHGVEYVAESYSIGRALTVSIGYQLK